MRVERWSNSLNVQKRFSCLWKLVIPFLVFCSAFECSGQDIKKHEIFSFILTNGIPHLACAWTNLFVPSNPLQTKTSLYSRAKSQYAKVGQRDGLGYWVLQPEGKSALHGIMDTSFSSLPDSLAICALEKRIYSDKPSSWLTMEAQYEIKAKGTNAIVFLFGDHRKRAFPLWNTAILYSDGSIEKNEFISGDLARSWSWFYPENCVGQNTNSATSKNQQLKGSEIFLKRYFIQHIPLCFIQMTVDQNGQLAGNGICLYQTEIYGAKVGIEISLNEKADLVNAIKMYDGERGVVATWDAENRPVDMLSDAVGPSDKRVPVSENKIQSIFTKGYAGRITSQPLCLYKTLAQGRIDTSFSIVPNLEGQPYSYGVQVVFSKDGKKVEKIEVYDDGDVVAFWRK